MQPIHEAFLVREAGRCGTRGTLASPQISSSQPHKRRETYGCILECMQACRGADPDRWHTFSCDLHARFSKFMVLRRPVSFGIAMLLMIGLPVFPLAVSAAIQHEATPGTRRELGRARTSFGCEAVTADFRQSIFIAFLLSHDHSSDNFRMRSGTKPQIYNRAH